MKYFKNKKTLYYLVPAVLILIGIVTRLGGSSDDDSTNNDAVRTIDTISIANPSGGQVTTTGSVVSSNEAELKSQASGQVTSSSVKVGDTLASGQVIVQLSNADIVAQLAQAQAAVDIQKAQLEELKRNNAQNGDLEAIEEQQDTLIENAYRALLNAGLQAYPLEDPEEVNVAAPVISGTYNDLKEGRYIIETYPSASDSGASFRISGLESGINSVSTINPVSLGTKGLYITFSGEEGARNTNKEWVVEIPNKRSSSYTSAKNAYDSALRAKDVVLNQSSVSDQRIAAQEAQVRQAQANVAAVNAQLAKTSIRAPFSGSVVSISANVGDYVSMGQTIARIINSSGIFVQSYVSSDESKLIAVGNTAMIQGNIRAVVTNIGSGINTSNGKVEVLVSPVDNESNLVVGEYVDISITTNPSDETGSVALPLKAVKPQASGSIVFVVTSDGILEELAVETGSVIGDSIEITSWIDPDAIIAASARGLRAGMKVQSRTN